MTLPDDVRDWPADALAAFRERAAIMEVDGSIPRKEAEWKALFWMRKVYGLKFTLEQFLEGRK